MLLQKMRVSAFLSRDDFKRERREEKGDLSQRYLRMEQGDCDCLVSTKGGDLTGWWRAVRPGPSRETGIRHLVALVTTSRDTPSMANKVLPGNYFDFELYGNLISFDSTKICLNITTGYWMC